MKIHQVVAVYYPYLGGVAEHVRNISERLSKEHEVVVCTTDKSGKLMKNETINNVHVKRFKTWAPGDAYYFSCALKEYLYQTSNDFDITHAHAYHSLVPFYAAMSKTKKPFFFTPHYHGTGHTPLRKILHRPYRLLGNKIFEKADKIICVSQYERDLVLRDFAVNEEKTVVIPNGFNLEEFKGLYKMRKDFRIILCVAGLEKYKGMQYLIEALPRLDKDIFLHIVGKGLYKETLVKLANKLNVADRVRFFQDLPRAVLLQEYANADLFVLLSQYEAYGISVGEALCSGTPCIVSNTSALKEWIDNNNCFGVEYPINLDELVNVITNIIGKPRSASPLRLLDWTEVVEKLAAIYEHC